MSDDLDVALGLDGGFGRPKKRGAAPTIKAQVEVKPVPAPIPAKSVAQEEIREKPVVIEAAAVAKLIKDRSEISEPSLDAVPTTTAASTHAKGIDRPLRRQAASSDARYGKLISLRVPSNLFEELERRSEEMGAKTVGQFLVAVLKIALGDQSMLAAPDPSPIYSAATGMSAAERLRATFAQKASTEASRQMTIRLDMGSVSKLSAAAKLARVKERAPYILAIIERQLRAL